MDEAIVKFYRGLLKNGFDYAGSIDSPTILLNSRRERIPICGQARDNAIHLYISINNGTIEKIKYLCTCDPTANVVIEVLCKLIEGRTITEAKSLTVEDLSEAVEIRSEEFFERAGKAIEFLNRGIMKYEQPGII